MSRLILQPSSNKDARNHYEDTILNPVPFSRLEPYLTDDELSILRTFYPNEKCYVWGVTDGGKNKSSWDKIGRGDVAVFSKKGKIFASSVVTHKLHNMELAVDLWKYDRKGKTWEYIYFLDEIHNVNIPYVDFNRSVINKKGEPYADNYIIQGFTVLEPEQCLKFFEKFDLQSDIVVEAVDESKIYRILRELNKLENTDVEILSKKRLEQAYLKTLLFDSKTKGYCACCGKEYPVSYLVTAHIKKRAFCSLDERKDKNIVFPMCKMGCDEIFERGYVSVEEGRFVSLNKAPITDPLSTYIDAIVGNECPYYNEDTEEYFLWHIDFHLGR